MCKSWITGLGQKFSCLGSLLVLWVLLSVTQSLHAEEPEAGVDRQAATLRVAILTDDQSPDAEKLSIFSELLGVMLQEGEGIALLERDQFEMVLEEIKVSQLVGADAVSQRLKASAMLDADILVMVHHPIGRADQIAVTLVETRYGLRLAEYFASYEKREEQAVGTLASAIHKRIQEAPKDIQLVVAVPPLTDARIDPEPERFNVQLAEAVQTVVGEIPGVLVLEVDEARALSREIKIRGDDRLTTLPDPLFITGRISTAADGAHVLEVVAERNTHEPITRKSTTRTLPETVLICVKAGRELVSASLGQQIDATSPDTASTTVVRLKSVINELNMIGDPDVARDLVETAILLEPESPALRVLALDTISRQNWIRALQNYNSQQKHVDTDYVITHFRTVLDHWYLGMGRIIRDGNRELRTKKGRAALMGDGHAIYSLYDYLGSGDQVIDEEVYKQINSEFGRHYQRLYRLLMEAGDESLDAFSASYLTAQFRMRSRVDPHCSLNFQQRAAMYERFQNRSDAHWVMQNLFRCEDIEYLSDQLRQMDERLDGLTVEGLTAYESGLNSMVEGLYGYVVSWNYNHTPKVDQQLKQPSEKKEKQSEQAQADKHNDADAIQARHIDLRVTEGPGAGDDRLITPTGWMDVGDYGELLFDYEHIYLMTGKDRVRTLYTLDPELLEGMNMDFVSPMSQPCFDGQYVWVTIPTAPGRLVAIDLETRTVKTFSDEAGMFPMAGGCAVAPLGRGEVMVLGATVWDFQTARYWVAHVQMQPDHTLSVKLLNQILPGNDDVPQPALGFDMATTLTNPEDPSQRIVLLDVDGSIQTVSTEDGKLSWLQNSRAGLSACFIEDGSMYFLGSSYGMGLVYRYDVVNGDITPIRPNLRGQGVMGMAKYDGLYLAIDRKGFLWGSRDMTEIAREMGPVVPERGEIDPEVFDPRHDDEYWRQIEWGSNFIGAHLIVSRYWGIVALCETFYDEKLGDVGTPWSLDVNDRHLAALDEPPAIPSNATKIGDRYVLNVVGNWSYPEATRLAEAYGARLVTIEDRRSYDALESLAKGRKNSGHHWTRLERKADKLFLIGDDRREVKIEGIPIGGAKEGYVLARWNPPAITGAGPHIRMKAMLEWPIEEQAAESSEAHAAEHPGPAWLPLIELPAGRFVMGNHDPDSPYARIEPQREVEVPSGLWMGVTEVTQAQWDHVMNNGPIPDGSTSIPEYDMHINQFISRLNQMTGLHYRLPTDAEWEYACRAGSTTRFASGDTVDDLRRVGWCSYDGVIGSSNGPAVVRSFEPNAWGFYDMHGNLAEVTCSLLESDNVTVRNVNTIDTNNPRMIIRGGSWMDGPVRCRSSYRRVGRLNGRNVGVRVLLDTRDQGE